ncbi:MAG: LysM peptidoglycan-binding domain-containing protein [gamma proteobacterium endosymbiont of Lamellibrachia anaximandri]|nr:LysM peptidoglycan-binding domain-containing protein [gamma proteobacterium endosymbiont of Lamellibrachia anaximandri]MBL3533486.1 LysM peptidoglycan-binding domain-containing protein [gamma proteobacterium endosymbiont of Lamellibrachia anaximandri]
MLNYKLSRLFLLAPLVGIFSACNSLPEKTPENTPEPVAQTEAISEQPVIFISKAASELPILKSDEAVIEPLPHSVSATSVEAVSPQPPQPPADAWSRMRDGFILTIPQHSRVTQEINWLSKHPDYIDRIQQRAEPYIYFILEEIDKRGMPAELALLPAVESAFQPFAYSPGRAAGIWQFIPSTGRYYGLKQNWWYDGRRDIVASTRSALDYLQALSHQFDGDWELALAAYNSGGGTVRKAIKRNRKKGKPTDYWSLKLPKETSSYVPRLLAIATLFADPDSHGISLQPIPNSPYFETIEIESQLDLALAAEMADLSIQDLYQLNPGFNRWATDPDGPHQLQLPLDKIDDFLAQLNQLPSEKRLRWKRYKIRNGDSLSVIARKHGTTTKILRQVNKLQGNNIRAGKHLLIPVSTKKLNHYALSSTQRKAKIQNRNRGGTKQNYTVKAGDNLWDIARTFKVNHKKLAKWNGMAPGDPIRPGQKLVLWLPQKKISRVSFPDTQPAGIQSTVNYRVRKGDSLSRIASRFNVTVTDLKRWNSLPKKYLQPGQRLKLYVDVTAQTL